MFTPLTIGFALLILWSLWLQRRRPDDDTIGYAMWAVALALALGIAMSGAGIVFLAQQQAQGSMLHQAAPWLPGVAEGLAALYFAALSARRG